MAEFYKIDLFVWNECLRFPSIPQNSDLNFRKFLESVGGGEGGGSGGFGSISSGGIKTDQTFLWNFS